MLKGLHSCCHW